MTIQESLHKFIVCGHRGFAGKYPENTMSAFVAAAQLGVDMIEMDIVATKDGVPVICHDYQLDRTSDGHGLLADYTLAQLKQFNMAAKSKFTDKPQRLCTFEEVCTLLEKYPDLLFNIDMKLDDGTMANKAADIVERLGAKDRVLFNGLNGAGLAQMSDRGFFVEASPDGYYGMEHFDRLLGPGKKKAQALCYNANQHVTPQAVQALKETYGVEVWAWCSNWDGYSRDDNGVEQPVDCRKCVQNMLDCGVTMALCNHPDVCLGYLKEKGLR